VTSILWLRRDLRRHDLPALTAAGENGPVLPLFVVDPALWESCGPVRRGWLAASVQAIQESYDGRLCIRIGRPAQVLVDVASELGADQVHVTAESSPFGRRRDRRVQRALARHEVQWVETGTPYAVPPGTVRNRAGDPYKVFTPFARAWREHLVATESGSESVEFASLHNDPAAQQAITTAMEKCPVSLPDAGDAAACRRWRTFLRDGLQAYSGDRDRPDLAGTSQLSPWLKLGAIHPRTLLADLAGRTGEGAERFVSELAWREFYADVLHHNPGSAWGDLRPELRRLAYDEPEDAIAAWREGRTGYPIVDAGMRQLLATGWMHNRVRMLTASFLTKDLHVWWPIGARHFMEHLIDGDLAANSHGWQWVAGTGTDAAPYFRVFNPVTQGKRFDPDGDYVRRWVPELAHLDGADVHEPWKADDGYAHGYPARIVDHAAERHEALERYQRARAT